MTDVLMSIHPAFAEAILAGTKTVELRRRRPSFSAGTRVLVYSTSPDQRIHGAFSVAGVIEGPPPDVWDAVSHRAGIDKNTFDDYFKGADSAYAIEIENPRRIKPATLPMRPPQSYQFLWPQRPKHRDVLRLAHGVLT